MLRLPIALIGTEGRNRSLNPSSPPEAVVFALACGLSAWLVRTSQLKSVTSRQIVSRSDIFRRDIWLAEGPVPIMETHNTLHKTLGTLNFYHNFLL